jgi:hypothetical protein
MLELAGQLLAQRRMRGRDDMVSGSIVLCLVERLVGGNRGIVCILELHTNSNYHVFRNVVSILAFLKFSIIKRRFPTTIRRCQNCHPTRKNGYSQVYLLSTITIKFLNPKKLGAIS